MSKALLPTLAAAFLSGPAPAEARAHVSVREEDGPATGEGPAVTVVPSADLPAGETAATFEIKAPRPAPNARTRDVTIYVYYENATFSRPLRVIGTSS